MVDVATVNVTTGEKTTRPLSQAELDQQQADATAYAAQQSTAAAFRSQIVAIAQSAVGITLANLTQAQIKSLFAVVLYKASAVDPATLQVRPLNDWT
jgi:hypothetical protein